MTKDELIKALKDCPDDDDSLIEVLCNVTNLKEGICFEFDDLREIHTLILVKGDLNYI